MKHRPYLYSMELKPVEKVLFKAQFDFWLANGLSQEKANELAMNKIIKTRKLIKKSYKL